MTCARGSTVQPSQRWARIEKRAPDGLASKMGLGTSVRWKCLADISISQRWGQESYVTQRKLRRVRNARQTAAIERKAPPPSRVRPLASLSFRPPGGIFEFLPRPPAFLSFMPCHKMPRGALAKMLTLIYYIWQIVGCMANLILPKMFNFDFQKMGQDIYVTHRLKNVRQTVGSSGWPRRLAKNVQIQFKKMINQCDSSILSFFGGITWVFHIFRPKNIFIFQIERRWAPLQLLNVGSRNAQLALPKVLTVMKMT